MAGILSGLKRIYLTIYNWTVFVGWLQVFYLAVKTLKESGHLHVYDAVERPLLLAQSAAVLEIIHGLVGLVRSPVSATLPQIGSRFYITWGILWSFPEVRTHVLVSSLVISWSLTEIIRYSFFGMKEAFGSAPSWLLWLRYSTFMLLYPSGITSEVGLIYITLPYIKGSAKYCLRMPNTWNFSFDYYFAALVVLGIYVPGMTLSIALISCFTVPRHNTYSRQVYPQCRHFESRSVILWYCGSPHMYTYMLGQRKKALSKSKKE